MNELKDEIFDELQMADLSDPDDLVRQYESNGYLFFRGVLAEDDVLQVKEDLVRVLQEQGLVKAGVKEPFWSGAGYDRVDDEALYALPSYVDLFERSTTRAFLEKVFKEPVFTARCVTIRYALPNDPAHVSAAHQDGFYVPGISALRTLWVPLMAIDRKRAPLAIAAGSHKAGLLDHVEQQDLDSYILKGRKQSGINWKEKNFTWLTADFQPGDVLMFHRQTVHRALPNNSDRIRLSLDTRCHPQTIAPTFQNQCTILELRRYRERAHQVAETLQVDQTLFETLILEMMARGTPAEETAMQKVLTELD